MNFHYELPFATALVILGILLYYAAPRVGSWIDRHVEALEEESNSVSYVVHAEEYRPLDLEVATWATSGERNAYVERRTQLATRFVAGAITLTGTALFTAPPVLARDEEPASIRVIVGMLTGLFGLLMVLEAIGVYGSARLAFRQRLAATAAAQVDKAITQATSVRRGESIRLELLFAVNRRQLDQYSVLTQRQQRVAFRLAQAASVVAFLLIVLGVLLALTVNSTLDTYLTTGLAGVGSLLSTFLAATFFSAYRSANDQMNLYYAEPQRTGRLLAAERILTSIDGHVEERKMMVETLMKYWDTSKATSPARNGDDAESGEVK